MTDHHDHFATLGEPRRPWLDAEALKARFHRLTVEFHPDVAGAGEAMENKEKRGSENRPPAGARRAEGAGMGGEKRKQEGMPDFSALNVAYQTLRDPRTRLRHLLELEAPALIARQRTAAAPAAVAALFAGMGAKKQALDAFLKKRAAAGSSLEKALLMAEQLELQEMLEEWLAVLETERERWVKGIPALDAAWMADPARKVAPGELASQIAETVQTLGFLDKWSAQIREGLVRLHIGS